MSSKWPNRLIFLAALPLFLSALSLNNFRLLGYTSLILPLPLLLAFHFRARLKPWAHPLVLAVVGAVCISAALMVSRNYIYWQLHSPREFDFMAFWYFGYTGASGKNFYLLETFRQLPPTWVLEPKSDFATNILNVGYLYAPPSMFWMLPLGWLTIPKAMLYWYGLQLSALMGVVFLLKRVFLPREGIPGWVITLALVALYPPVTQNLWWAQTNFTALLAALLFWKYRSSLAGGIWVGIGMTIKNYFPAFLLFSILRAHFHAVAGYLIATLVLSGLSLLYFGPETCLSYFTERPPTRTPLSDLTEIDNQSLSAFFLRHGFHSIGFHPVFTWPYLVCAVVMTLATAWAIRKAPAADTDWGLALTMVLVMIFYPGAWQSYATMSLPALFLLWSRRSGFRGGAWLVIAVLVGVYAFTYMTYSLFAHLLLWPTLLLFAPGLPWSARMAAPNILDPGALEGGRT